MTDLEVYVLTNTVYERIEPQIGHKGQSLHAWIELIIRVVKEMENIPSGHHLTT